ncbi:MAG: permease-like cell division protein FtsX, partial [Pseudomonadales bacterium]|nr:permease-like cell division protein FtsX [Pseudomonadales bacterium]
MKSFTQARRAVRRSPYQSLTAVVIVFTTFLLIFSIANLMQIAQTAINFFEVQPEVTAFFRVDATDEEVQSTLENLNNRDYVTDILVIDRERAFEIYSEANANEPLLIELLSADLFPVSISLSADSPEKLMHIREDLQGFNYIDYVIFNDDIYEQFLSWTNILRQVGIAVCIIFGAQLVLVLIVIMSMMVSGKRESIKIMSIIGATRGKIKAPFIINGLGFGFWGSLLAFATTQGILYY